MKITKEKKELYRVFSMSERGGIQVFQFAIYDFENWSYITREKEKDHSLLAISRGNQIMFNFFPEKSLAILKNRIERRLSEEIKENNKND